MSLGKKLIRPHVLKRENGSNFYTTLYLCILEEKKFELTFSNFSAIKKLELDFPKAFSTVSETIGIESFTCLGRRNVLMGCRLCNL